MSLLQRYLNGECEAVWQEMAQGSASPEEVKAITREAMERVLRNAERLVERLRKIGYVFDAYSDGEPILRDWNLLTPPPASVEADLEFLRRSVGSLPLALTEFWLIVGQIDLMGHHPDWAPANYPDALVIYGLEVVLADFREWRQNAEDLEVVGEEPLRVNLAPDFYHKENVSGGLPYSVELPSSAVDPPMLFEPYSTTFIGHLRLAFQWGGFPGFSRPGSTVPHHLQILCADLEPM